MTYRPEQPPRDVKDLSEFLARELRRISESFEDQRYGAYPEINSTPEKPRDGMIRYADGTNWNPGYGEGFYAYVNSQWVPMSQSNDFYFQVADGQISGYSSVNKFGRNDAISATFTPICMGGVYRTPTTATTLRIKAGDASDDVSATGAQVITLQGLDDNWTEVEEDLTCAGTAASSNTSNSFYRLFRAYVSRSGTYGAQGAGSHAADIVIENSAGTEDWLTIDATDFPRGQSEVGAYTVPAGKKGYVKLTEANVDANKNGSIILYQRPNADDLSANYSGAIRIVSEFSGLTGRAVTNKSTPFGPFVGPCDIGFMAKLAALGAVNVDFEIILKDV